MAISRRLISRVCFQTTNSQRLSPLYIELILGGETDKCEWIGAERVRWAKLFGIPMNEKMSDGFPPLTLNIMRTLCALTVLKPGQEPLVKCLDALYEAYWVRHEKTIEKDVLVAILAKVLREDTGKKGMS